MMSGGRADKALNPWGRPAFGAVAAQGKGVIECFVAVVQDMLAAIAVKYNLKEKGLDPRASPTVVQEAFAEVLRSAAAAAPPPPRRAAAPRAAKVVISQQTDSLHAAPPQTGAETGLVSEELLHRSLRSNVELAEALAGLVREMNLGLGAILSQAELLMVYREDAREKRQAAIAAIQQEAARLQEGRGRARRRERGRRRRERRSARVDAAGRLRAHHLLAPDRGARPAPRRRPRAPRRSRPSPAAVAANGGLHDLLQDVLGRRPGRPRRAGALRRAARPSEHRPAELPARDAAAGAGRHAGGPRHRLPSAARSSRCAASASRSSSRDATARSSATS